jgi:hypothetical protein
VFSVLGLGHIGADKFVGGTISGSDRVHLKPAD